MTIEVDESQSGLYVAVFQNDRKHVGRNLIEQMAGIFDLGQMSCNHFSYI